MNQYSSIICVVAGWMRQFHLPTMLLISLLPLNCFSQESSVSASAKPTKAVCIQTLKDFCELLEKQDYNGAAKFLVVPADFKPEMLDGFIKRQEISQPGIRQLEESAKFGTATEVFGTERATYFANRAGVETGQCYGFNYETKEATAEVIGLWDGSRFKFVRVDDVGKLQVKDGETPPKNEEPSKNLADLKLAVESNPEDVAARGNYAMALYQNDNPGEAWRQLLAGYQLQPKHTGMAKGIGVLMAEYERRGVFRVGTPEAKIEAKLGSPQQKVSLGSRQRWVYAFLAIDFKSGNLHEIVDLRARTEDMLAPTEILTVDLDGREWKCGSRRKRQVYATAVYFLPNEDVTNWTEQVEIERITGGAKSGSPQEIEELVAKQVKQRYPNATHQVLGSDESSVIVAFVYPATSSSRKRYQLVRLLKGQRDMHRLAYTIKTDELSEETQSQWLNIFKSASLKEVEAKEDEKQTSEDQR